MSVRLKAKTLDTWAIDGRDAYKTHDECKLSVIIVTIV